MRLSIGADHRVDRLDGRRRGANILDVNRNIVHVFDDDVPNLLGAVHLSRHEAEKQLMLPIEQPRRVDDVRAIGGVQDVCY